MGSDVPRDTLGGGMESLQTQHRSGSCARRKRERWYEEGQPVSPRRDPPHCPRPAQLFESQTERRPVACKRRAGSTAAAGGTSVHCASHGGRSERPVFTTAAALTSRSFLRIISSSPVLLLLTRLLNGIRDSVLTYGSFGCCCFFQICPFIFLRVIF